MVKQLRIPFPDYTVKQQERDVERFKQLEKMYQPHIFLLKVDGMWASLTFSGGKVSPKFYEGMDLYQTFNAVKKSYPLHKMKYIINQGLENYLRDVRKKKQAAARRQLSIDFNGGKNGY